MIRVIILVGALILVGNLLVLNYFVFQPEKESPVRDASVAEPTTTVISTEKCGAECLKAIEAAVDAKVATIKIPTPKATSAPALVSAPTSKTREWIIPLGSGVVNSINTWTDVYTAQAQIDTSDYSPIQQAYFEVIMHIPNATGEMSARLFDTTTPYLYAGQVLSTTSDKGQLLSVPFPIQSGTLNYRVQLYTSISQGVLDAARIRLVTQ